MINIQPLLTTSATIQLHLALAVGALVLGLSIALQRKGTALHQWSGRIWSALMLTTAASSIGIQSVIPGHFSPIHLLSVLTLCSIPFGILAIRQGNLARHKQIMLGNFAGLAIAGVFTLIPGRMLGQVFFGW